MVTLAVRRDSAALIERAGWRWEIILRSFVGLRCAVRAFSEGRELAPIESEVGQLPVQDPAERHPALREDPSVVADADGWRAGALRAAGDPCWLCSSDEIQDVDVPDAAVCVGEVDVDTLAGRAKVKVEHVPVLLDEDAVV